MPVRKSRSPRGHVAPSNEGEIADDLDEDRQIPNAFVINRKGVRLARADLSNTPAFFGRKARSNSPKGGADLQLNTHIRLQALHQSGKKSRSPVGTYREDADSSSGSGNPPPHDLIIRFAKSPAAAKTKPPASPGFLQRLQNSEDSKTHQPEQSEEVKALKALARKKRQLNEELWEAAADGDLVRIGQLLEP